MTDKNEHDQALVAAVIADDTAAVQSLLEQGASVSYTEDSAELQPLHFAALYDSVDVIPLLVMAGADVGALTDCDDTALSIAKRHGYERVVAALSQLSSHTGSGRH
jgi:ankyrin repeat protein